MIAGDVAVEYKSGIVIAMHPVSLPSVSFWPVDPAIGTSRSSRCKMARASEKYMKSLILYRISDDLMVFASLAI